MEENISVREYQSIDHQQVVDLILSIQQEEYNIPITKNDQPDLFQIESFYQHGKGKFWVALHGGKVVGTIGLLDIGSGQVALRKMFVESEYRGKEFKTAFLLLNKAIEWSKDKEVKEIFLGTTLQFVAAHRFYEKNGFQEIEKRDLPENYPVMGVDRKFYRYEI